MLQLFTSEYQAQLITKLNSGKKIKAVFYYYLASGHKIEKRSNFIEAVEIAFQNKTALFLRFDPYQNMLNVFSEREFKAYKNTLENQFQDKILFKRNNASMSKIWKKTLKSNFSKIIVCPQENKDNIVQIQFENYKIEIINNPIQGLQASMIQ